MEDKQISKPAQPLQGSTSPTPTLPAPVLSPAPTLPLPPAPTTIPTLPTTEETLSPVASVIGEIAAHPEIDSAIPGIGEDKPTASVLLEPNKPVADIVLEPQTSPVSSVAPDAPSAPANPQPGADSHTVKLPVPTSMLPALAVGALVLVLLLAVALYAFVA